MSSNNVGCGCIPSLFIIVIIFALFLNPSLEDGKKKLEADVSNRALIQENDVRLYRNSYFLFSEYYLAIGDRNPQVIAVGFLGFILEKRTKGFNKDGEFSESVKLE